MDFISFKSFPEHDIEVMHQFEMVNGQARILVQTAAHVAGAAYYYQRRDVTGQPWPTDKVIVTEREKERERERERQACI